ncbi:hypothetical protein [Pseudomonas putida]|uniref:hypothetical protein n=1 Tax=Pseudomonas putida TaxID=303 RepID=UPI0011B84BA6|nr:hypothetical protein [Pseudomonas putida]
MKSNIRAMTWSVASAAVYASFSSRTVAVIRIDTIWLATEPMDMCAGTETAMARLKMPAAAPLRDGAEPTWLA